jgi:hypothetical protein
MLAAKNARKSAMAALALMFATAVAHGADAPNADPWAEWRDNFDTIVAACVKAAESNCLSKAFASRTRPSAEDASTDVSDSLYRDLQAAEVMLHQKDARDLLWHDFGIDASDFLGTGYSVPLTGAVAHEYEYARQREYFVPNLCAEAVDLSICPKADSGLWTWRLSAPELARWLDKPIASFLKTRRSGNGGYLARLNAAEAVGTQSPLPALMIRFGTLPLAYYKGTVGRPGSVRVFFANFGQVRSKTLRAAMIATGASSLLDKPDPEKTFFIWLYAPDATSKATVASWKSLFDILSQQPVP